MKSITIFGSSGISENSEAWQEAHAIGKLLAESGFTVINGGYSGTMRAASKGAKEAGGKTLGITTEEFSRTKPNEFLDEEFRASQWHERLYHLMMRGDGFVVLDGGTGTLVELIVFWEMANKHFHDKPAAVLGRYMQEAVKSLRKNPEVDVPQSLHFVDSPKEAAEFLAGLLIHA